jgi:hypothetical protein
VVGIEKAGGAMRITVRKEPSETGLARVCQAPRGFIVSIDGKTIARVGAAHASSLRDYDWHWYGGDEALGVARRNSAAEGINYNTKEEARDACVAYVKDCLTKAKAR